ncbi:NERD domain-containing protein [Campylobacter devanensis]|uniref:NERD domain-containing protein n=1 Tax=Campylobacter devanensis TaxID=3161138 RepID=UPI000A349E6A|nr:NERD domain-containing protein [Campylobacter sp. P0111]
MAKLFPSLDEIRNGRVKPQAGELYLLETLIKELDDTYEVYFNPLLNGDFPDIVVFRYGFGIYIIEVKDWNLNAYEYHIEKAYSNKTKKYFLRDYMYIKNKEQRILPPMNQVREYRKNIMEIYCFTYYQKLLFYKLESKFKQMPNPNTLIQTAVYFHSHDQSYIKNFFTLQSTDPDEQKLINSLPNRYVKLYGNNGVKNLINDIKKDTFINKIKNFKEIFDEVALLLRPSADFLEQRTAVSYDKLDKKQRELSNYQKGMIKKVKGKAGSGKTLTLANIAIKAFEDTQDIVLILCFNITLRNKIRDFISRQYGKSTKNSFLILHFHDFLKK